METYENANLKALIARMPLKVYLNVDSLGLIKLEKGSLLQNMRDSDCTYEVSVNFANMTLYIFAIHSNE